MPSFSTVLVSMIPVCRSRWPSGQRSFSARKFTVMSDLFYNVVVLVCRHAFVVSGDAVVLHANRIPRNGPFILASTHTSPFDVPVLMRASRRRLDFVSITEVFSRPYMAWFYSRMNAFPLDRNRKDPRTVRIILDRLKQGRAVAMFPEGRVRAEAESVVHGANFRPGVARIARMAGVAIIPVVVWGATQYSRPASWLPLQRTRYGINFGDPLMVNDETDGERELARAYRDLYVELRAVMDARQPPPARAGAGKAKARQSPISAPPPPAAAQRSAGSLSWR